MKKNQAIALLMTVVILAVTAVSAWAKDQLQAAVTGTSPAAIVEPNGNPPGTIHVVYTVNDYQFPVGNLGEFTLDLSILATASKPETIYPLSINLYENSKGAENLILTPSTSSFLAEDAFWSTGSNPVTVTVAIPDNPSDEDGTVLTGILNFKSDAQMNTIPTIVVKVALVHPTACLKMVNFVTDTDFNALSGNITVNVQKQDVKAIQPGQLSYNILVVNSCGSEQQLDLRIALDSCFDTSPNGNPGQAVFTYLTSGAMDKESFDFTAFGLGTGKGQGPCLSGLTIPAGETLLTTVHMGPKKELSAAALPSDMSFDFTATVYEPGGCSTGTLNTMTDDNPAAAVVPFELK